MGYTAGTGVATARKVSETPVTVYVRKRVGVSVLEIYCIFRGGGYLPFYFPLEGIPLFCFCIFNGLRLNIIVADSSHRNILLWRQCSLF